MSYVWTDKQRFIVYKLNKDKERIQIVARQEKKISVLKETFR